SGDLRQRQVHENHAAFHHMYPEIGMKTGENQAGQERRLQEWKDFHVAPLFSRVKSFDQQSNIVVEKLKIICHLFLTAYGRSINYDLRPGGLPYRLWGLEVEIRFHEYDLAVLSLHQLDKLDCVARCGRDAGPGLYVTDHVQIEVLSKIGKRAMIGDYLAAMVRLH